MCPTPCKSVLLLLCYPSHLFYICYHEASAAGSAQSLRSTKGLLRGWNTTTLTQRAWEHSEDHQLISQRFIFSSKRNKRAAEWGTASSREYSSHLEAGPGCSFEIRCRARWIEGKETVLACIAFKINPCWSQVRGPEEKKIPQCKRERLGTCPGSRRHGAGLPLPDTWPLLSCKDTALLPFSRI